MFVGKNVCDLTHKIDHPSRWTIFQHQTANNASSGEQLDFRLVLIVGLGHGHVVAHVRKQGADKRPDISGLYLAVDHL